MIIAADVIHDLSNNIDNTVLSGESIFANATIRLSGLRHLSAKSKFSLGGVEGDPGKEQATVAGMSPPPPPTSPTSAHSPPGDNKRHGDR